jgi:hypothetical protein
MRRKAVSAWTAAARTAPLVLALTACSSSGSGHAGSSGSPSATSTRLTSAQPAAGGQRWSACIRKHGVPRYASADQARKHYLAGMPEGIPIS